VAPATTQLERVQVTGTAIRRVDAETAVPVTILRTEQLEKEGVHTTEELVSRIVGSQSTQSSSQAVGSGTGGASFADMRGIGQNKTLILLNGRRLANNAIDGAAVDLNTIPFAALDRVEILRDGASALYGTDAIGGVINFITKNSVTEGQISAGFDSPTHSGGGESRNFSGSWGFGDLEEDRFNVFGVINYDKQHNLSAVDRSFTNHYDPSRGINSTSGTAAPSNYTQGSNATNPLSGSNCNGPNLIASNGLCRFDTRGYIDLVPETEKTSIFSKATAKLGDDHTASLEYFWARNNNETFIAPAPLTGLQVNPGTTYYPGNGITPAPTNFALDPTQPVGANWREVDAGGRAQRDQNTSQRLMLTFDGSVGGWDYNVGASYNENKVVSSLAGGYVNDEVVTDAIANGILNPFGEQSQAGIDLLGDSAVKGDYETAVGRTKVLDARVSREIGDWFGAGPSAIALGGEFRKEDFHESIDPMAGLVQSLGVDPNSSVAGDRTIKAQYAELNVPVLDTLELTAAVRHDKYSDFGSTTNPKYSFRFQPIKELVVRGAYSEGFRAPSLYELYDPNYRTYTAGNYDDPVLCRGGSPSGGIASRDCSQQFFNRTGGNEDLSPETARNKTFGFVYQPIRDLSVGLDFWWIDISNQIEEFPETAIFANPDQYADRIVRAADGSIDHVVTGLANLGKVKTNGIDLSLDYRFPGTPYGQFGLSMQGTYVNRYDYQQEVGGAYTDNVGDFQRDRVVARWKHAVTGSWSKGPYRASMTNRFQSGYRDYDPETHNRVASYSVWDLSAGYTWNKVLDIDMGVKNLFDRDPPFSNQAYTFQSGYDPRYTDPLGRTLFTRATYHF
jgi:iron complex outermembrane receptor protein